MMRRLFYFLFAVNYCFPQNTVSYLQYFRTEKDFIAGTAMPKMERFSFDHLAVSYNEKRLPIYKNWISENGDTVKSELLSFYQDGALKGKSLIDSVGKITNVFRYGETEPWSLEFRTYYFPETEILSFMGQESEFSLDKSGNIQEILFKTVNGVYYGSISFRYNHHGLLTQELWVSILDNRVVRRFELRHNFLKQSCKIWEYGKNGEQVSHVGLEMIPEEGLYNRIPPQRGNILQEVFVTMEELRLNRITFSGPEFIPIMEWDRLVLKSGEKIQVDYISSSKHGFLLRFVDESDILTIPRTQVESLTTRWGEILYPKGD